MEEREESLNERDLKALYILVDNALAGNKFNLGLIRSQAELRTYKIIRRETRKTVKILRRHTSNVYRLYLLKLLKSEQTLVKDLNEVDTLLEMKKLEYSADFYQKELQKVKHLIKEFRTYRFYHKWRVWILNEYRPEEDLVDWTTVPFTWF